jgi:heme/copper-type cytochrome/quinol oxidase subunit 3
MTDSPKDKRKIAGVAILIAATVLFLWASYKVGELEKAGEPLTQTMNMVMMSTTLLPFFGVLAWLYAYYSHEKHTAFGIGFAPWLAVTLLYPLYASETTLSRAVFMALLLGSSSGLMGVAGTAADKRQKYGYLITLIIVYEFIFLSSVISGE